MSLSLSTLSLSFVGDVFFVFDDAFIDIDNVFVAVNDVFIVVDVVLIAITAPCVVNNIFFGAIMSSILDLPKSWLALTFLLSKFLFNASCCYYRYCLIHYFRRCLIIIFVSLLTLSSSRSTLPCLDTGFDLVVCCSPDFILPPDPRHVCPTRRMNSGLQRQ